MRRIAANSRARSASGCGNNGSPAQARRMTSISSGVRLNHSPRILDFRKCRRTNRSLRRLPLMIARVTVRNGSPRPRCAILTFGSDVNPILIGKSGASQEMKYRCPVTWSRGTETALNDPMFSECPSIFMALPLIKTTTYMLKRGLSPRSGRGGRRFESYHSDHFPASLAQVWHSFRPLPRSSASRDDDDRKSVRSSPPTFPRHRPPPKGQLRPA